MLLDAMQYSSCTQSPLLEMWKCVEDTASLAVKSGDMGLLFEHVLCFLSGLIPPLNWILSRSDSLATTDDFVNSCMNSAKCVIAYARTAHMQIDHAGI